MGSILYSRDGEGLYDHEGYVSQILDDGSSSLGTWTAEIERRTVAWRAECTCGWQGCTRDSGGPNTPSASEFDAILEDWELSHAEPLLEAMERRRQLESLTETVRITDGLLRDGIEEALARGASRREIAAAIRSGIAKAQRLSGESDVPNLQSNGVFLLDTGTCDGPTAM